MENIEMMDIYQVQELIERTKPNEEKYNELCLALVPHLVQRLINCEEEKEQEYQDWLDNRDRDDMNDLLDDDN